MTSAQTQVRCHSGYRYAERPLFFEWEHVWHEVESVAAEWASPESKVFRVVTTNAQAFELAYAFAADAWTIKLI